MTQLKYSHSPCFSAYQRCINQSLRATPLK
jgi:hypothetical protein